MEKFKEEVETENVSEAQNNVNMDQENLIQTLGVEMVDREQFEAKVMREVDEVIKVKEAEGQFERVKKELKMVVKSLQNIKARLEKCQKALNSTCSSSSLFGGRSQYRKSMNLMEEQEELVRKKEEELTKQVELTREIRDMGKTEDDLDFELVRFDERVGDADAEEEDTREGDAEILMKPHEEEETEQERQIRLGEMTAFGTNLKSTTGNNEDHYYQQYLKDQAKLNKVSQKPKKRKRDKFISIVEYGANGSDDSDWEFSDDETKRKMAKKRSLDDGDKDEYLYRLEQWQKQEEEMGGDHTKAEQLDGGLKVPYKIWEKLYNYQKVCVQWLWELHQQKVGGILGDEMGLGKTIQIIAFLASMSFSQRQVDKKVKFGPVIIVCPTTVMHQWVKEFHTWWPIFRVAILHESGSHKGSRDRLIRSISLSRGVLVTSYSAVLSFKEELQRADFQYVILDEGHKIRNPDAQITLAVKQFPTSHRLILSGSPLQNNLKELWSLFDFIYPGKLGTLPVFMQQFSVPITQGGYATASRVQVATAYKCATILRDTINPYLLRRMKNDVKQHILLPEKNEQVLFCNLTEEQRQVYKSYLDSGEIKGIMDGRVQVFVGLINLRKICNHPDLFDGGPKHYGSNNPDDLEEHEHYGHWERSGKMIVIQALLKLWKKQGHKVLLFTQSRQMLQIFEKFVQDSNYSYLKLDGSTSIGSRQPMIEKFNKSKDIFVFLLTTKVGGLGVNLTGATRVVIFDPDWNPSTDTQARERAWRIGQDKQVTIYRLMTAGTIEEKIYHRQIFKQFLVNRVLKDPKQKRFFKANDLYELFTLNEGTSNRTETSALFAGTNSEVQMKKKKKKRREDNEGSFCNGSVPCSKPKRNKQFSSTDVKTSLNKIYEHQEQNEEDEMSEREKLRARIRAISQKIGQSSTSEKSSTSIQPSTSGHHSSSKSRHEKRGKFEGHKISHLVKSRPYQPPGEQDNSSGQGQSSEEQDSYVLSKLFKKSGVHTAMQHDVIVDAEGDDYVLIEGEAERVAKEAVDNLRRSRRDCFRAEAGVPTWTGSNGVTASRVRRFGKKNKPSKAAGTAKETEVMFSGFDSSKSNRMITSSELLSKIKQRNRFLPEDRNAEGSEDGLFQPDNHKEGEDMDLLADIRNFIAFQARVDGKATTQELVERFKNRVPAKHSPLFKALLTQICDLQKASDSVKGDGVWILKPEFA